MSTKTWVISELQCVPKEGDMTDVVIVCHWRRNAKEIVGDKEYFADVYGSVSLPTPEGDFTPYQDLTYLQVCGWLDQLLDTASLDANLDGQIENQVNPPIIVLPLPWEPAPTPVIEIPVAEAPAEPTV